VYLSSGYSRIMVYSIKHPAFRWKYRLFKILFQLRFRQKWRFWSKKWCFGSILWTEIVRNHTLTVYLSLGYSEITVYHSKYPAFHWNSHFYRILLLPIFRLKCLKMTFLYGFYGLKLTEIISWWYICHQGSPGISVYPIKHPDFRWKGWFSKKLS